MAFTPPLPWANALPPTFSPDPLPGGPWVPQTWAPNWAPDTGPGVAKTAALAVTANLAGPEADVSAGAYSSVQYVALELCTRTLGFELRDLGDDDSHQGLRRLEADLKGRAELVRQALEAAHRDPRVDARPTTLKVFMAPEYVFRGPTGSYAVNEILGRTVDEGLPALLGDILAEQRWEHWVVCFGTMTGCSPVAEDDDESSFEIYNVCVIQKGGVPSSASGTSGPSARAIVVKQCRSTIDVFSNPVGCLQDTAVRQMVAGDDLGRYLTERCFYREDGDTDDNGIFNIAGVTFGFEVCLDHAQERLKSAFSRSRDEGVQIQLVATGGMDLQFGSVATVANGLVFHIDGLLAPDREDYGATSSAWVVPMTPSEHEAMCKATQHLHGGDLARQKLWQLRDLGEVTPYGPLWRQHLRGYYDVGSQEPKVRIYAAVALPH